MTPAELKKARYILRLSQERLGGKIHRSGQTVAQYEQGKYKIPKTFELAVHYLLLLRCIENSGQELPDYFAL